MITREDYEAGRVRRRDGGEFRIYKFAQESMTSRHIGEILIDEQWRMEDWFVDGSYLPPATCGPSNTSEYDLILAPRTVYLNLYPGSAIGTVHGVVHDTPEKAKLGAGDARDALCVAHPIEIEE